MVRRASAWTAWVCGGWLLLCGCGDDASTTPSEDATADAATAEDATADAATADAATANTATANTATADAADADPTDLTDVTPDPLPPQPWDATLPGHYGVGYRTLTVVYGPRGVAEPAARTLRLAVWYPTRATEGRTPRYFGLWPAPGVLLNAPIAPEADDAGPLPLLVYSHGHQGFAEASAFLAERFASHGWLVAAPDHTGNTTTDDPNRQTPIYHLRAQDVSATLDLLANGAALAVGAPVQTERAVVAGHSFGGYTAMSLTGAAYALDALLPACEAGSGPAGFCSTLTDADAALFGAGLSDPRLVASVLMAPGDYNLFDAPGVAAIDRPTLLLTGGRDTSTTNAGSGDPIWAALDGPDDLRLNLPRGGHITFTIACGFGFEGSGCAPDDLPPADAHAAINAWALTFARAHLLGDAAAASWLAAPPALLPPEDLTLSRK